MIVNKHIQQLEYPEYTDLAFEQCDVNLAQHKGRRRELNYTLAQDKELCKLIARMAGVSEENILVTAGADAALHHIAETFLGEGRVSVTPTPSFGRFEFHTKVVGAKSIFVKHTRFPFSFNLGEITKVAGRKNAAVIFLSNPNNPTGELLSKKSLRSFIKDNNRSLIVIDEVLVEENKHSVGEFVRLYKNLVVVGSFSKLLGAPGLRTGYILGNPRLLKIIDKTVSPYEISSLSLYKIKELLLDSKYLHKRGKELREARGFLKKHLALPLSKTQASVGLIASGNKTSLFDYLLKQGILSVNGKMFRGLEKTNTVRVIIDNKRDMVKLIEAIRRYERSHS